MPTSLLIGAGAGLIGAALFASAATATALAGVLFYLAPLPVCLAGLGWGGVAALLAAVTGTVVIGTVLGPATAVVFAAAIAVPAALLLRLRAYPLTVVLGWAAFRRDRGAWAPALTLAVIGISISTWHILVDTRVIDDTGSCDPTNPCTVRWAYAGSGLGQWYLTIQVGAFCCFLFIIGLGLHALARRPEPALEA